VVALWGVHPTGDFGIAASADHSDSPETKAPARANPEQALELELR